jgi:FKBP-type peptidyl-prolyl cis-trans isomerase FkpA
MITTPSGLQYLDTTVGEGAEARKGQSVTVHYTGWLYNDGVQGGKFDSSKDRNDPFVFSLGAGMVIRGWDEGVAGMKVGGARTLIIPAALGYGARGAGGVIPPNATLKFDVDRPKAPNWPTSSCAPRPRRKRPPPRRRRNVQGPQVRHRKLCRKPAARGRQPGGRLAIQNATPEQLREGSDATLRQLTARWSATRCWPSTRRRRQVRPAPAPGHQHGACRPGANTVVTVLQKGYLIAERVLRPALVTVTAPK